MHLPKAMSVVLLSLLAACAAPSDPAVTKRDARLDSLDLAGPMLHFPPARGLALRRPNEQVAQDFLDLEFRMESGRALPVLTRFEGPVTVSMTGAVPPTARAEMQGLIARLRDEAGVILTLLPDDQPAALTPDFERRALLRRLEPTAACFVIPNVSSLAEYRARRGSEALDWAGMRLRSRATLFLPSDTSPQEVRDCLHEETAQALGPVNDLYRLPDSVFNDDNFQSVLTGFDMLMLRLHYAPELASGMTEAEVAARLPALIARLNPKGEIPAPWISPETPRLWLDSAATALTATAADGARLAAAGRMLAIAEQQGWQDNRLGFAHYILGRLKARHDPLAAEAEYDAAARVYETLPDGGVHLAHALMQLSAIALARGQDDRAIGLADRAIPLAMLSQNASLLATLKLIKAEALEAQGHSAEAAALRLDSLPAARYGFGSEAEVRARTAEIAAIARMDRSG